MARPRVLLVEDDASLRHLVTLALEDLPIALQSCASVEAALPLLRQAAPQLLITDLMMPGTSGLELLERLAAEPALRGGARLVAFSAGLDAAMRTRLQALGVWRMVVKPASLDELEACVREALAADEEEAAQAAPPVLPASAAPWQPGSEDAGVAAVIQRHFGGDAALFHGYRACCRLQFGQDLVDGEQALAQADAAAMRRLGHSLKSVLATLGLDSAADGARTLEKAALAQDWGALRAAWAVLRPQLLAEAGKV